MYCKDCGKKINADAVFCKFCGNKMEKNEEHVNYEEIREIENNKIISFVKNLFRGRLGRLDYFLFLVSNLAVIILFILIVSFISGIVSVFSPNSPEISAFILIVAAIFAVIFWFIPVISAQIRRLHDINMSGLWIPLLFVPGLGAIFAIILLFSRGNIGDNKYGKINSGGKFFNRILNLN